MKKTFTKIMLLLFALVVGVSNVWAAEGDTHDFAQSLGQLLNNNASIPSITIAQQNYTVKEVIVTYRTTQSASKFTMAVTVGGTDFGSYYSEGKMPEGTTHSFPGTATQGAVTISFTNNSGSGTGKGTLYVTNVRLVEGASGGSSAAATTTTINASGIANTDLKNGTAAGSLSASVTLTSGGDAVPNATVTWSGDNDAVATINSSTGAVTLVGEGDVNFTASYAGVENEYAASTSSKYKMTVTDTRYTVSDLTFTAAYGSGPATADDDVEWTVTSDAEESTFTDDGIHYGTNSASVTYVQLSTSGISGTIKKVKVTTRDAQASASVTVTVGGTSFYYGENTSVTATNTSTEYAFTGTGKGQIVVRIDRGSENTKAIYVKSVKVYYEPGPEISADDVDIAYDAVGGSISYGIVRPVDGATLQATVADGETISSFALGAVGASPISFTCAANNESTPKTATVTLNYVKNNETLATKDVTITQGADEAFFLTGRINFGSATGSTNINGASITGNDSKGNTWTITTTGTTSFSPNAGYAQVGSKDNPANTITFTTTLANSVTIADFQAKFGGFSGTTGTIKLKVGNNEVGTGSLSAANDVTVVNNSLQAGNELTVTVTSIAKGVKCYYISYTILSYDIKGDAEMTNFTIPVGKTLTIHNGGVLTITNTLTNSTASNLVIEDGGQLKLTNGTANVQATMKRNVAAWTGTVPDKGDEDNAGWYAIASPVNGLAISSFIPAEPENWNVYRYDEPTAYWNEYRSNNTVAPYLEPFTTLTSGVGYLYRSTVAGLEFKGVLNAGNANGEVSPALSWANTTNANLKGFNLVGNPFSHNISWTDMTKTDIGEGYYLLDEDPDSPTHGKWGASTTGTIAPTQAFLVKAASASAALTIKNNLPAQQGKGEQANHDNIMFSISNGSQSDEAYVLFKEGYGLNKISHRNSEIPMLYVIDNGTNYAVAAMPDNTQSFILGFEAKTTGRFTLSFKASGEFNYLHVIDRMTGEDIDMLLEGEYSFIGSPMDNANRFIVRLGYLPNHDDNGEDIFAYQSGSDVVVSGEGELQIFDVMGRMISIQRINGVETINVNAQGVYIFKLNEKTQKIVVK